MASKKLIEKVAQSLAGDEWNYPHDKDRYRRDAKAAISTILTALQEPTEGMCKTSLLTTKEVKMYWPQLLNASPLGEKSE